MILKAPAAKRFATGANYIVQSSDSRIFFRRQTAARNSRKPPSNVAFNAEVYISSLPSLP